MSTKMYLVEQREDWKPGDCYVCKFTCKGISGINPDCPMKGAKEAVEVKYTDISSGWGKDEKMVAKCKYWIGPYKECKLINTHKPCPSNVDLTSCNIIPKKPKTKSVAGYVALNKAGIAYAFKPASQSDYWDKKVWTEAVIAYRVKGGK